MHQSSAASPSPQLATEPRSVFSLVGALLALAAAAGPLAVLAVLVLVPTIGAIKPPPVSGYLTIPAALDDQEHDTASAGPMERSAVLTVGAGANVAVRYSSSWEHAVARCIVETSGVPVYIVNATDADTSAGTGPYCDTCRGGATIPPIGHGHLRTSAGVATVRCSFNDGWSAGLSFPPSSSGGGMSMATADARYLMLDASNDPLTGQLAIDSGASGTQLLVRGNGADAACSPGAAFNPSIKFSGSAHGMGIAQGLASGADELAICNDGARMSIGSNSAEFSFANGVKPDGDDIREMGTSGRRWILNGSQLLSLRNGTNTAPAIAWSTSPMTGFATPTTHSIAAFSQGVTIWEGGGGVFNLSATMRSSGTSTAAAPEWSYQGDQDTGVFRAAADTIAISTGGTQRAAVSTTSITTTLPLLGPAGTAAAPSVSYSGDTDTGMYRSAADTWAVSAGGTLAAYWDATYAVAARHLVPDGDETRDLGVNGFSWDQLRVREIVRGNPGGGDYLEIGDSVQMRQQTTNAAPDVLRLPAHIDADVTTNRPTCSTSADAGKLLYIDDDDDAVVAGVCVCGANAANTYGWRSISNFGVNCHL